MTVFWYVLTAAVSVLVLALTAPFCFAQKDGPNYKSLTLKLICAFGYIAVGLIGIKISGHFDAFQKIMFGALAASWVGDLFLHLWKPKWLVGIGFLGFLSAHGFFIWAFYSAIIAMNPEAHFFNIWQIAVVLCFDIFFIVFSKVSGMDLKPIMYIPLVIYATMIMTMFCNALSFGITAVQTGAQNGTALAVCAIAGAANFVASDFSISILMFNKKQKKNMPLKLFNMFTYFIAELALAFIIALH